jgi:type II secretory pathway pseudopilin PulG
MAAIHVRMAAVPLRASSRGFTVVELMLAMAVVITVAAISVPLTADTVDRVRTGMAARYLAGRVMDARMEALRRSARVALRFEPVGPDYRFGEYLDGNGDGVRTADIAARIDPELTRPRMLRDQFPNVAFGLLPGVPDVNGTPSAARGDGVRIGSSRILTLGPDGTATSGTLYVHGRYGQYAIRILGATGRTRVLRFDEGSRQWVAR